jgi:hypothetical protein
VAARTSLALLLLTSTAAADDADIIGRDPGWRVEDIQLRTTYLDQSGRGFQSQAGALAGPGSEAMWLVQPWTQIRVRQSERVAHVVTIPVDVVTGASPDAVDAVSSASRTNESVGLNVRSTYRRSEADTFSLRAGVAAEEPLVTATLGGGWRRSFADDNATVALSGVVTYDGFDYRDLRGRYVGPALRWTYNGSIALSQLLSPTTIVDGSYGVTQQEGKLGSGWNSVPASGGTALASEVLPHIRRRHALTGRISQHIPLTHSTAKLAYRAYRDDFGIDAHTITVAGYQYVTPWLYVRAGYRFHYQTGADFFTTMFLGNPNNDDPRTADSDLAELHAHEWSLQLATLRSRKRPYSVSAELLRYERSNALQLTAISLAIGKSL